MTTIRQSKTKHFMALDGLRGVAAIVVAAYHCRRWISPTTEFHGYLAVDLFFLLSGFVIAHAYGAKIAGGGLKFREFAASRAIRLYPIIVLGAVMGTGVMVLDGMKKHLFGRSVYALAALPFALLGLPQPFLQEPFLPNGPVWSLFFEIIANVVYFFLVPRLSTRWITVLAVALGIMLVEPIRIYGTVSFGWLWPTMALGLLRVGFPFMAGVVLQRMHEKGWLLIPVAPIWILGPLVAALLIIPILSYRGEVLYTLAALFVIFPLIVASASNDEPSPLWSRISKLSAEISYPLYLTHYPILRLLDDTPHFSAIPVFIRMPLGVALCIVFSLVVARYYDAPVRAWLRIKQAERRTYDYSLGGEPPADLKV